VTQKHSSKKVKKTKTSAKTKSRSTTKSAKKKAAKATTPQIQVVQPKLPALPKEGLRDIGELSFGKKARKKPRRAPGAAGLALAGSTADRRQVADTRQSPFRKICDLIITAADGTLASGTAWFISPRTLITSGHCVAVFRPDTPAHGMVRRILVMPARNGETDASNSHFGWIQVEQENLRVHESWLQHGILDFDYGAIILPPDQPLGATVGFFGYQDFPDQTLNGSKPTLAGYPDNAPDGTQWFETNPIRQVSPGRLFYDIFTAGGQSGSPVFFANNEGQVACAIHNFGDTPFNSGVRLTPSVVAQLNAWRA
jgi:V8-like Glu-specific endopeptidase